MEDQLYKNKNSVRACIGIIKTMNKVSKSKEEEEKKFVPEAEEYRNSTDYKKMIEELKKKEEDDEYRNDYDPKGYDLYERSVSLFNAYLIQLKDPIARALEFTQSVAHSNPDEPVL